MRTMSCLHRLRTGASMYGVIAGGLNKVVAGAKPNEVVPRAGANRIIAATEC
jgi:hypothetical protein